jgi:uncharacterized protein (DUF608 family)
MKIPPRFVYTGRRTHQISFPLGGIGTGCIGLAGNGRLVDWEIFNKPNKGSVNGFSHFAVKAEAGGRLLDARVLQGDLPAPYMGDAAAEGGSSNYGFGPRRETLAGLPHFRELEFVGRFPLAELRFADPAFPGRVTLTAFNPFIPLNDKDSGIPGALFDFEVRNTGRQTIDYTVAATLGNPLAGPQRHVVSRRLGVTLLQLESRALAADDPQAGNLTLGTDARRVSFQSYWFRGAWFDALEVYWRDFSRVGGFRDRRYAAKQAGDRNQGVLAAHVRLRPGGVERVRFVIAWHFPVCENYWRKDAAKLAAKAGVSPRWRNYYATLWKNSAASARYALTHWPRLYAETRLFRDALFASDLPPVALEAVSANLSTLKSPTVLRLEDGTFYGFEGCFCGSGCCEGSCTHVWNYAQALPFLFSKLARAMRAADYRYNQQANGGMPFRLQLPLGIRHPGGRSCADGLFGNVMLVYRDWKISGDTAWLRKLWPAVRKSIAFAWARTNEDGWDPEKTGVLWGRQHHTLDMELFGPSSWLCGFYLGALKAAAEMAEHLGEAEPAREYRALFAQGKAWVDRRLFNGEYYQQRIDLKDAALLRRFKDAGHYWNKEHREIKYQIGDGCEIDQVLAQWHATLYGMGEIFDPAKNRKALEAIYRHNFLRGMRGHFNPCRLYALNDEAGAVICSWPKKGRRPVIPLPYAQEAMHGFEYAAGIQMIQAGLVRKGMAVVRGVRDRYDGVKRNPWNEIECGSHYARSMASYALLNAFSGFAFDAVKKDIGFVPVRMRKGNFRCFWSLASGWGEVELTPRRVELRVLGGVLELRSLGLPAAVCRGVRAARAGNCAVAFRAEAGTLRFAGTVRLRPGQALRLSVFPCGKMP